MTKKELNEILKAHKKWLNGNEGGKRAEFTEADLRYADLRYADLRGAELRGAELKGAELKGAELKGAELKGAELTEADLRYADLREAELTEADLRYADLREADLTNADLSGADLSVAKIYVPLVCPEEGAFIAFKKAANGTIIKLRIPEDAKRSSATTRKCRCDKAVVLSIENPDGTPFKSESVCSLCDNTFVYTIGKEVSVPDFDENRWNECAAGIHFFITRDEAVRY